MKLKEFLRSKMRLEILEYLKNHEEVFLNKLRRELNHSPRAVYGKLKSLLKHGDCHEHLIPNEVYFGKSIPIAGVGHQAGTCRFGNDPDSSVLDSNCKAHQLDNLYVVDTSFFCSIGAVNPSLTAMANALRVGDHLLNRLGAKNT